MRYLPHARYSWSSISIAVIALAASLSMSNDLPKSLTFTFTMLIGQQCTLNSMLSSRKCRPEELTDPAQWKRCVYLPVSLVCWEFTDSL